jgi:transcriptional regulator with XRE-family HTH domain
MQIMNRPNQPSRKNRKNLSAREYAIRHAMLARGINGLYLAHRLNVSPAFVSMWIRGDRRSVPATRRAASLLGLKASLIA